MHFHPPSYTCVVLGSMKAIASGYNSGFLTTITLLAAKLLCLYVSMIGFNKKLLVCVAKITANKPVSCD